MFGLWYLSLAIDELRKYLGLSSIFDYFKGTKTGSNKAIEDKKSSNNSTDNKNQVPQSKPILKPAPQPPKPVVEPTKPAIPQQKPVVEPPKPAPEPPKPVAEPPRPAPEPPRPAPEPPKPVAEPSRPSPIPLTPSPKSTSPPKPSTPTKQITPPPATTPTNVPKKEPSPPQPKPSPSTPTRNDLNNIDRNNMFAPSKKLENGDTDLKSNIKDATTSFLQEEGRQGPPKPQQSVQPSNVNFKQL